MRSKLTLIFTAVIRKITAIVHNEIHRKSRVVTALRKSYNKLVTPIGLRPLTGTPANIRIIFLVGPVKRFFPQECASAVQGHLIQEVIEFATNRKRACDFLFCHLAI